MIQAVIFDMDGLLIDSERPAPAVMQACGRLQQIELSLDVIMQGTGSSRSAFYDLYRRHYPTLDPVKLMDDFREKMKDLAREGKLPLMKGARELLSVLRERGIPCAVASSSPPDVVELYLEKNGVLDAFAVRACAAADIPSKPAPDVFLRAAEALGVAPQNCLVLEDSINGIKAGRAAGMRVVMVPGVIPFTPELQPYCDAVVPDLNHVIPLVAL